MASPHLFHSQYRPTCCCNCNCSQPSHHSSYPPQPSPADPLLQTIASHLLLQQHSSSYLHPQIPRQSILHPKHREQHFRYGEDYHSQATHLLSSLLHRVASLENSLRHLSSSSSSRTYSHLRHAAARTIQSHFRTYLVRRSQALRHLKHLALIKSSFNSLKSSLSDHLHLDLRVLSSAAMDLLLQLDSVQGDDPMIREGKRSVSRDLDRFLEFIDVVSRERREISTRRAKDVRFGGNGNKPRFRNDGGGESSVDQKTPRKNLMSRTEDRTGTIGVCGNGDLDVEIEGFDLGSDSEVSPRVFLSKNGILMRRKGDQTGRKKSVTFAEDKNFRPVSGGAQELDLSGGDNKIDDQIEFLESIGRGRQKVGEFSFSRMGEDDEEVETESGGSSHVSDGESSPTKDLRKEVNDGSKKHRNILFSPPIPVKMETRDDLMKKKSVRIAT